MAQELCTQCSGQHKIILTFKDTLAKSPYMLQAAQVRAFDLRAKKSFAGLFNPKHMINKYIVTLSLLTHFSLFAIQK